MREKISDRDHTYLRTKDNVFFCVAGDLHSEQSIFGQPYYFLHKELENIMDIQINKYIIIGDQKFTKLKTIISDSEYPDFIKHNYPEYYYSPSIWEALMRVDRQKIVQVLDPRDLVKKFQEKYNPRQYEENTLLYILDQITRFDSSLISNVGITGSLLLHNDLSQLYNDVDLVIYGRSNIKSIQDFSAFATSNNPRFSTLAGEELELYALSEIKTYPGTMEQLISLMQNRWDRIFVDGIKLDFSFSAGQAYIDSYDMVSMGKCTLKGKIINDSLSNFLPTLIDIESDEINTVLITSRRYTSILNRQDTIGVHGEKFYSERNNKYYIVVDNNHQGYITKI